MALKLSTGARDQNLATEKRAGGSWREIFQGKVIRIRTGTAPATADAAATGTLLATITNNSVIVAAKQKMTVTVDTVTNAYQYWVKIDGVKVFYTSDGSATEGEIIAGLVANINNVDLGVTAVDVASTSMTVEANVAGTPFEFSVDTVKLSSVETTADAYGLHFETDSEASSGELEKASAQTWSGTAVATGTAGYARLEAVTDDGTLSTTAVRLQGNVNTSGSDFNISTVSIETGATVSISSFKLTSPYTKA